jgi:hypothetical protein
LLQAKQMALLVDLQRLELSVTLRQSTQLESLQRLALLVNLLCLPYLVLRTWMLEPTLPQVFRCCCCWSDCLCLQCSRRLWHQRCLRFH